MRNINELSIRINPETCNVRVEQDKNGIISCKNISEAAFLDCIKASIARDSVDSGFLPQNCFHVSIQPDMTRTYCVWHPELYADISYYGTEYPHFPLPRLVFRFQISPEGKVFDCRMGVVEDGPPKGSVQMFYYPFSNVGADSFKICLGNNVLPVYKKPHTLASLPNYILSLPNNNDSFNAKFNRLHMGYRDLLHHLSDKEPSYYYTDVLIPSGKTLKDFVR